MVLLFLRMEAIARKGAARSHPLPVPIDIHRLIIYTYTYILAAHGTRPTSAFLRQVLYIYILFLVSCSEYALFFLLLFLMTSSEGGRRRVVPNYAASNSSYCSFLILVVIIIIIILIFNGKIVLKLMYIVLFFL